MPSFYNGKRFFLTYAQCAVSAHELAAFLIFKADVKYYLVATEKHADGSPHLHACVEFATVQRHAVDWLDFQGHHPNKQDPRNWNKCLQYCKKDGDFIDGPEGHASKGIPMDASEACAQFEKQEDWMDYCVTKKMSFPFAMWYWSRRYGDNNTLLSDEHVGTMAATLESFKFNVDVHRTVVLKGPAGCGKTTWAKRSIPKPCLFVSHIDQLKEFRVGFHVSIIFDDVDISHYPRTSQIHVVDFDNPRAIHCRHAIANIPAGIYKIFTSNNDPLSLDDPAIKRRVRVYNV